MNTNVKCVGCDYYAGRSKKNGKPYFAVFVKLWAEGGQVVTKPVFLAPWDIQKLGIYAEAPRAEGDVHND